MRLPIRVRSFVRTAPTADVTVVFTDGKDMALPERVTRQVRAHARRASFQSKEHETHVVPLLGTTPRSVFLVGVGKAPTLDVVRRGLAAAVAEAKKEGQRTIAALFPSGQWFPLGFELGRATVEGVLLANYRFTTYAAEVAKRERMFRLRSVALAVPRAAQRGIANGVRRAMLDVEGTLFARNLVNEPASRITPASLAAEAQRITKASAGRVQVQVLNRKQCAALGMGAFLAVAQGSVAEPVFIHLAYRPGSRQPEKPRGPRASTGKAVGSGATTPPRVALVGKGITFDSGGLSLKTSEGMETMKIDMAGAAAVLGVFSVLPKLRLPIEVHGFIAACENMPSGKALKPGDIVRTASGKTIEVLNTDAEGRLTLADAFSEALKLQPDVLIDLATLTGACVVALGEDIAGLFSNNESTARRLLTAATAAGEYTWRLPLFPDYRRRFHSAVADFKNTTGNRYGGALSAALFLEEFVGNTPWAHVDIAGPSYAEKPVNPVHPVGGTGFGVRTVLRYLEALSEGSGE